jgi:hypothetical protein
LADAGLLRPHKHAEGLSVPPSSEGLEAHDFRDCFPTFPKDSFHPLAKAAFGGLIWGAEADGEATGAI